MIKITSRSAIETQRRCKRMGYYQQHAGGTGLVLPFAQVDLLVGTAGHKGVEEIFNNKPLDDAVAAAVEVIDREERIIKKSNGNDFDHYRNDLKALVELLLRMFHHHTRPEILAQYRVVSVEEERPKILTDDIVMEVRTDALFEELAEPNRSIVFSLKTCGSYAPWLYLRDRLALQNFTEPWAYGAQGVQMCYLIKGTKGDRFPFEGNALLYPWYKGGNFSWSWFYTNAQQKRSAIGPTWDKIRITDMMKIKEWVDYIIFHHSADSSILTHRVNPFDLAVTLPSPTYRHEAEIKRVIDSLKREQKNWFDNAVLVDEEDPDSLELHFPREYTECSSFNGQCVYYNACTTNAVPSQLTQMGFVKRIPHHAIAQAAMEAKPE